MEIAPVPGIRIMPATKARPADPELTFYSEVESAARPEEDTYAASSQAAAGAEEPEEEAEELDDLPEAKEAEESCIARSRPNQKGPISVFV